ncbi:MAG: hypothetical protein LBK42_12565 [Propionibacteriaceae bacterium]|jgi:site-specific DNA-methyltransferase (adenine-specific)|nr:hypothetical protein [Propionibacteriaceae bacterium]
MPTALLADEHPWEPVFRHQRAALYQAEARAWLSEQPANSVHACVTDPPYGLVEYSPLEQRKLRAGRGGVWRVPPSFDGCRRSPLPRFTTLTTSDLAAVERFFYDWAVALRPVLAPGGHVFVAANPLVSHLVSYSLDKAGFERRGEVVRLVQTMRGGDRPKGAEDEFAHVSAMPRSQWEPWLLFRKPFTGTLAANLRRWGVGGLRRLEDGRPFGDVIASSPTRLAERRLARHPSLKPQAFLRQVCRAALPLGEGVVLDPFAGSGSTLAACNALGYDSVGVERDTAYVELARDAIPALSDYSTSK